MVRVDGISVSPESKLVNRPEVGTGSVADKAVSRIVVEAMEALSDQAEEPQELKKLVFVKSDAEIIAFAQKYKDIIMSVCSKLGLPASYSNKSGENLQREEVMQEMQILVGTGRLKYDPSKGAKESTFIYKVAKNVVLSLRRRPKSWVDMPDEDMDMVREKNDDGYYGHHDYALDDCRFFFREAIARMAEECSPEVLEALVRFVLLEEDRSALAREYGYRSADGLSVLKTRWWPRLMAHVRNVVMEDAKGALKPAPTKRIEFLKRFVKWL